MAQLFIRHRAMPLPRFIFCKTKSIRRTHSRYLIQISHSLSLSWPLAPIREVLHKRLLLSARVQMSSITFHPPPSRWLPKFYRPACICEYKTEGGRHVYNTSMRKVRKGMASLPFRRGGGDSTRPCGVEMKFYKWSHRFHAERKGGRGLKRNLFGFSSRSLKCFEWPYFKFVFMVHMGTKSFILVFLLKTTSQEFKGK